MAQQASQMPLALFGHSYFIQIHGELAELRSYYTMSAVYKNILMPWHIFPPAAIVQQANYMLPASVSHISLIQICGQFAEIHSDYYISVCKNIQMPQHIFPPAAIVSWAN